MSSSPDDFTQLQALLKLKKYEQPPPGFFDELPDKVHRRLRGPEGLYEGGILATLGFRFGLKPALFAGMATVCCLLSFIGATQLLFNDPPPGIHTSQTAFGISMDRNPSGPITSILSENSAIDTSASSTNPVLNPGDTVFPVDPFRIKVTPASYQQP